MAAQKPKTKEQRRARRNVTTKPKKLNVDHIIEQMVKAVVSAADYDIGKQLDPETAEEPEYAEGTLYELVLVAKNHLAALLPGHSQEPR